MKNIKRPSSLLMIILMAVAGCNIYTDVYSDADLSINFSLYKTFAWLPDQTDTTDQPYNNEIIRNNIRNYFGQSLAERGYKAELDTPDVLLSIVIINNKKEGTLTYRGPAYCTYYGGSIYYFPYKTEYYYRHPYSHCYPVSYYVQKYEYLESSITFNMIDRKKDKLIWSGTARGDIYDPAYINKNIHPAVEAIMKQYPVKVIRNKRLTD